jgi:nucleotide-binding universal stress UspA family protein
LVDWAEDRLRGALAPAAVQKLVVTSAGLDAAIARVARYSDLIIASQPYGEGSTQVQTIILEAVLFGTGAPVMVIPRTAENIGPFERVMVAWDESTQALEAVRKALPALKNATRAEIVMINPPSHSPERSDPGGVICVMLARHGVKADVSILAKTMPHVAEVINRHAQDHAIDLIVMGAYGHSRFREAMIGGATRDMLETARVPILMAH